MKIVYVDLFLTIEQSEEYLGEVQRNSLFTLNQCPQWISEQYSARVDERNPVLYQFYLRLGFVHLLMIDEKILLGKEFQMIFVLLL